MGQEGDLMRDVLSKRTDCWAYAISRPCVDVGTPRDYLRLALYPEHPEAADERVLDGAEYLLFSGYGERFAEAHRGLLP